MWLQKLDEVVGEALHGWQVPLLARGVLQPIGDAAFSSARLQDARWEHLSATGSGQLDTAWAGGLLTASRFMAFIDASSNSLSFCFLKEICVIN